MKTKKPQPLDLEETANRILKELSVISCIGDSKGIQYSIKSNIIFFVKQRLKSACEFYLRYKDKPELLEKENHKLWVKISNENRITTGKITDQYNEWLFKLAFKDVLKEEK